MGADIHLSLLEWFDNGLYLREMPNLSKYQVEFRTGDQGTLKLGFCVCVFCLSFFLFFVFCFCFCRLESIMHMVIDQLLLKTREAADQKLVLDGKELFQTLSVWPRCSWLHIKICHRFSETAYSVNHQV